MELRLPPDLNEKIAVFVLILTRFGGLFAIAPFFTATAAPARLRALLAAGLTVCVAPLNWYQGDAALAALANPVTALVALAGEFGIGLMVGMVINVLISAITTAGYIIALDMGLAIANVLDPVSSLQTSVVGQMKSSLAILLMLLLNLHHHLIVMLSKSFEVLPPGFGVRGLARLGLAGVFGDMARTEGSELFATAVQLAAPVSVILILVTVTMAFLARTVPEMNVFVLGFALRILVGLWVLALIVPAFAAYYEVAFEGVLSRSVDYLRAMARGTAGG